jgi:hypothetical protein
MTNVDDHRRIVAWTDGSDQAAHSADWAAQHAVARSLPLHVLRFPRIAALVGSDHAHDFAGDSAVEDRGTPATVTIAAEASRLRSRYPDLPVSVEIVQDGREQPGPGLLHHDDVLVTWPSGYLDLVGQTELEAHVASHVPVPTVFVPNGWADAAAGPRVLLLAGSRFFPSAALFAFAAASDLGAAMNLVRLPTPAAAEGDDYWIDRERSPYAAGPHLRAELAKLQARFPDVHCDFVTLRIHQWAELRAMTRTAHLAVLGVGCGCGVDVRAVYDLDTCPVAIVPEP